MLTQAISKKHDAKDLIDTAQYYGYYAMLAVTGDGTYENRDKAKIAGTLILKGVSEETINEWVEKFNSFEIFTAVTEKEVDVLWSPFIVRGDGTINFKDFEGGVDELGIVDDCF